MQDIEKKVVHMLADIDSDATVRLRTVINVLRLHLYHWLLGNTVHGTEYGGWNYGRDFIRPHYDPTNLIPEE